MKFALPFSISRIHRYSHFLSFSLSFVCLAHSKWMRFQCLRWKSICWRNKKAIFVYENRHQVALKNCNFYSQNEWFVAHLNIFFNRLSFSHYAQRILHLKFCRTQNEHKNEKIQHYYEIRFGFIFLFFSFFWLCLYIEESLLFRSLPHFSVYHLDEFTIESRKTILSQRKWEIFIIWCAFAHFQNLSA